MISQETCAEIWSAYREIEVGEKLLSDMKAEQARSGVDKHEPVLRDAFGRLKQLELGVPCGQNGHRLFNVSPILAESVIRAHIAAKQAQLVEANERARIELDS